MKKYVIIDTNKDGSGNIVLGEYKDERVAEERALEIAQKSGMEILVCEKKTAVKADITERIKTYEDACRELDIPLTPERCKGMTEDEAAYYSLKVIAKALNEGWEPDWSNINQKKWSPWFKVTDTNPAGLSYSNTNHTVSYTAANFGSHLCFKTSALAEYAGKQFIKLYEKYLL